MVHGLLWLPVLVFFFWITWAGWNEYQKVETYQQWATQFERAKYDIFAALGQRGRSLTWGLPTRQGVINLQTLELDAVDSIDLLTKGMRNLRQRWKVTLRKAKRFSKSSSGTAKFLKFHLRMRSWLKSGMNF
ncbi:MAG: hypothetical protein AAF959_17975 [Cyanobacteria bacterium P01_D01_bin.56]